MKRMLSTSGRSAFKVLLHTAHFAWIADTRGGLRIPYQVRAFRTLMREPRRVEAFRFLAYNASLPGQAYGLAGLYLLDKLAFRRRVAQPRNPAATVLIDFLGYEYSTPFTDLLEGIASGDLPTVLTNE